MAEAEGRSDKWSVLLRFLEFHICRLLRKLALISPLVLLLHLGSLVVFFASGQPPPLATQHTAGGVELTTTTEGVVGQIPEETNHGANSSYYATSSDNLASSYVSEPPHSPGFLGSSAAKKSMVLDSSWQEGGKNASTAVDGREGVPVASEPQQMSSALGETASGRGVLPTRPSSAFLGCPISDHQRRRSTPSEAQLKRADDEYSSTTVPSIPVSSAAGFSFPALADVSTSRRQARGLSPNDCSSTTTATSSQTALHSQPAPVIHRTLGASAFPAENGQAPQSAFGREEDLSGVGNTHGNSGALVTHDPPEVLETLLLPRLRADLQEHLHDSYHSYYFSNDGRESSGNDDDVVSTQPPQPLPQDTREKDTSENSSKSDLELEGSAKKVKDYAAAVDLMVDAVNTKLNLALPGIEVLTKPTLALAKPFISTAWSLFGLFASPLLAVKKSIGKSKSPSPDDRKHPERTCCADCADEECVSVCSTEQCESKQTCVSAGDGAYSGFCLTVCSALAGMSVMPATADLLHHDEACRDFCALRVRRLCETHACEDFGCYAENCARLASFRCG